MRDIVITLKPEDVEAARLHACREDLARSGHPGISPDTCVEWLMEAIRWTSDLFWQHGLDLDEGHVIDLAKGVVYVDRQES